MSARLLGRRILAIALAALLGGCSSPTKQNAAPQVAIGTPTHNATFTFGATVAFSGSATDEEDGALAGASLVWTSNVDGEIGTGGSFSRSDLSGGGHTVTLTATDSDGKASTHFVQILINRPPVATITAPTNNAEFTEHQSITFTGSATDPENGALTGFALVWTSSLDGQIGTGVTFARADLSDGTHTITLTASDLHGATGVASIGITILDVPGDPPVVFDNWVLPIAYPGVAYSATLQASGGIGTFSYEVLQGSLPSGMSLSATGAITGNSTVSGVHHFMARVTSGLSTSTRVYSITVSTVAASAYNLQIANVANSIPSVLVRTAIDEAAAKWEAVITGDRPGGATPGPIPDVFCQNHGGKVPQGTFIDDMLVLLDVGVIDGPSMIIGQAGPCGFIVGDPALFVAGALRLDSQDLGVLDAFQLRGLVFHEIGHIIGVGTLWDYDGRTLRINSVACDVSGPANDPRYVGAAGVAAYTALGGGDADIDVEESNGCGTANTHWDEDTFNTEVMTGFSEGAGVAQPVSSMTIGSVGDLGYTVNLGAADAYTIPGGGGLRAAAREEGPLMYDAVIFEPIVGRMPDATIQGAEPSR